MIYLASPHWAPSKELREERALAARSLTAHFLKLGSAVFSPINHNHWLGLDLDHAMWLDLDKQYLRHCSHIYVAQLPGWENSKGIKIELALAIDLCIMRIDIGPKRLQEILGDETWQRLYTLTRRDDLI